MQNLLTELENLLSKEDKYVSERKLLKNIIIEDALKLEPTLLKLLLSHKSINKHFFQDIDGIAVFDKVKFQKFVSNKSFLPDSYTAFKNKIGLTVDDEYITEGKDVVLSWPYKDCVLEGGQDKEDAKRDEIFWNETLAPDEIDRLLSPKVLTNWKKYDKDGEHEVKGVTENDNLIIKGNNLLGLSSILKKYRGKIKLIYIDPPYNIDSDSFKYNDSFNHSTWLTFMKNRLETARELLHKDGVIFIHTGDRELHYLKVCADEVLKRENFIATIPRKTRSGKTDVPWKLSQDFDWMLIYTKGAPRTHALFQRAIVRRYYSSNDYPGDEWRLSDLTTQRTIQERPNSDFTLINPKNGEEFPVNPNRCWGITKDSVVDHIKRGKIVFPGDYDFLNVKGPAMRIFKSEETDKYGEDFDKTYVSTDFLNKAMDDLLKKTTNKKGTDEIFDIFGEKIFAYPKNELLIKHIIEYCTIKEDIVLDFFLGSGTTAAVAHKMNRHYIGLEQMDYVNTVTTKRLQKVIEGEQGGISKEFGWQGGGSFIYCELAKANQEYVEKIQKAKKNEDLQAIWKTMQSKAFISYYVDIKAINDNFSEFEQMPVEDQKRFLIEILDKNMLYVPYTEIDDEDYKISAADKKLNKMFYER